uniref:Vacuolar protein sorting-associated protein 53 homolog n=1 Tax=Trichobilharzia regenti TaxID=157069 RepID=A0AA85K179_TRIRE|nr:unnamed protein product [Trichobilharzia regenti]
MAAEYCLSETSHSASVRNRRQLHIRSVKHTYWGPKSGRKSSKKTAYVYRQHSGKQKTFSSGASEIRKSEDQIDGSYHSEPIKRIQSLAENVRDEIISLEEVKPILHDIAQEMVQGVIEGSEEKLLKFVELVERQQEQLENIPDTIEEIKTIASIANFTEPISRQNSKLSEISAQELSQAFLDNLTDNVSVYLEDILDEVLLYTNERKKADGDNDTIGNEDDVRVVDIADKNSSHNN